MSKEKNGGGQGGIGGQSVGEKKKERPPKKKKWDFTSFPNSFREGLCKTGKAKAQRIGREKNGERKSLGD